MAKHRRSMNGNYILASIPAKTMRLFERNLEEVDLELRHVLYDAGKPVKYVWFLTEGVASLVASMQEGGQIELATIGSEGVVGLPIILGADRIMSNAFMQVPGRGFRMKANVFRRALKDSKLRELMLRYTLALISQISQSAACNRLHSVDVRCA